jgi:hypothetical protein
LAVVMEKVFMMGLGLFKNKKFKKSNWLWTSNDSNVL